MGFEDRLAAFQERLQFRVLGVWQQDRVESANDGFVIGDFVVDVSLIELSAVHSLELRQHFVAIRFQALAGVARFRRQADFFGEGSRLVVHRGVIANHCLSECFDFRVLCLFHGQLAVIHINRVGREHDLGDLGVVRWSGVGLSVHHAKRRESGTCENNSE